jgi:hypothetical protein
MMDADGSTDGAEIERFVAALRDGADYAKGSRFMDGGGSEDITLLRRAGNLVFCWLVNRFYKTSYTDLCYGYNAFWRSALPAIAPDCAGFEVETLLNVRAAKAGLHVAEVPSVEHLRIHGKSNLHPVRDGLRVLRTILREREHQRRSKRAAAIDVVGADVEMPGAMPGADVEMLGADGFRGA